MLPVRIATISTTEKGQTPWISFYTKLHITSTDKTNHHRSGATKPLTSVATIRNDFEWIPGLAPAYFEFLAASPFTQARSAAAAS
jgi:hypothetical protein